jgi:hypothetical protein
MRNIMINNYANSRKSIKSSKNFKISFLIILALIIFSILSTKYRTYNYTDSIVNRTISIEKNSTTSSIYSLMWWSIENDKLKLNLNFSSDAKKVQLYALTNGKAVVSLPTNNIINLSSDYSGSFNAVLPEFTADFDNNGSSEPIRLCSKIDTIYTQGFAPKYTFFNTKEIGMEVYCSNSNDIFVYLNGEPLSNKEVLINSLRGFNKKIRLNENGSYTFSDIRELRSGINVVYVESNGAINIANYILEGHSLFTKNYFYNLLPLSIIALISISGIIAILLVRKYRKVNNRPILNELGKN